MTVPQDIVAAGLRAGTEASLGNEYASGLREYKQFIRSQPWAKDAGEGRIEHQFECLRDWSVFHTLPEVEEWFIHKRNTCPMETEVIPLSEVKGWNTDPATGNMSHKSGEFFAVHGVRCTQTLDREVTLGWDQPFLTQVGYDGGRLGILRKRFSGIPHYLIEAKAEPGNYAKLQLSPTLQATFSNLGRAHRGKRPRFAEYFEQPDEYGARVLYNAWLSEDGGRLYLKRNMGIIVEVSEETEITMPEGFIWMTMFQMKACLWHNAWVNPHVRGIIAHL